MELYEPWSYLLASKIASMLLNIFATLQNFKLQCCHSRKRLIYYNEKNNCFLPYNLCLDINNDHRRMIYKLNTSIFKVQL